jgi:hypothetical protein
MYSVIAPFATPISVVGNSFPEAVKNFVKLQKDITLNQFIITDQINNMHAYVDYVNKQRDNGKYYKKANIRMRHTRDRVLPNYPYPVGPYPVGPYPVGPMGPYPYPMGVMGVPASGPVGMVTGFPINGPAAGMPPGFLFVPPDSSRTSVDTLTSAILNTSTDDIIKMAVIYSSRPTKDNIRTALATSSPGLTFAVTSTTTPPKVDARNLRDLLNKTGVSDLKTIFTGINPNVRTCIENALKQQIVVPLGGVMPFNGRPLSAPVDINGNLLGPAMPINPMMVPLGIRGVPSIPF